MRILSVDDSAVVRKIIRGATEVLKYEFLEAEDGIEALELVEKYEGKVDLILLDWNMPGLNGFEVLETLKKDIKYKNIPIMMVTTEGAKGSIVKAIQAGAINYLVKPFTMEDLIKKIVQCLGMGVI